MTVELLDDAAGVAERAADRIIEVATAAISDRGRFAVAFSGGRTPAAMLAELAERPLPWPLVHVFQVDERVAPDGHPDRNAGLLLQLATGVELPASNLHLAPVAHRDPEAAARAYERDLRESCGGPPVLDLVQLGLGSDGHTASLVGGDPVLDVDDRDAAPTGPFHGRRRVTLTVPAIGRARHILWIVTGAEKADAVRALLAGDPSIPASRIRRDSATLVLDRAAARDLSAGPGMGRDSCGDGPDVHF